MIRMSLFSWRLWKDQGRIKVQDLREATRKMFSLSKTHIITSPLHEGPNTMLWLIQSNRFPDWTLILERSKRRGELPLPLPPFLPITLFHCHHPFLLHHPLPSHHCLPLPSPLFLPITPSSPNTLFHCHTPSCCITPFYHCLPLPLPLFLTISPSSLPPLPFPPTPLLFPSPPSHFLSFLQLIVWIGKAHLSC